MLGLHRRPATTPPKPPSDSFENIDHAMPDTRYSPWIRRLHWLVFILVACALALIYLHDWSPRGSALRADAKWAHMQFGIAVLLVMLPRLLVRSRGSSPPINPAPPRWQDLVSKAVHLTLYLLLFATPLLGLASRLWNPADTNLFGFTLAHVAHPDKVFAHKLEDIHGTFGNILMYLAAFHALAALVHHYVQRDDALKRMLPPVRDGG